MEYPQAMWLLVFFTYCFLGWVWESLYDLLLEQVWVNRGFLYGPLLPIYGVGAIIVLWLTLPIRDNRLLIFGAGMLAATLLEIATGTAMERLFQVRYWNYSNYPLNLNGYISLFTSLGWGLFSVLLVQVLHPQVENLLLQIPYYAVEPLGLTIMTIFVADATISVQAALDLKELIKNLTERNQFFALLETKLDNAAATISQGSNELQKQLQIIEADIQENIAMFQQREEIRQQSRQAFLLERLQERRDKKSRLLALLNEKTDAIIQEARGQLQSTPSEYKQALLSRVLTELSEFKEGLKQTELNMAARRDKEYKIAANLIRRNPSSISLRFREAFEEIKSLNEARQKRHKDKEVK